MHISLIIVFLFCTASLPQKIDNDVVKNYSEFFNFGYKKHGKYEKDTLENSIVKSKVEILGAVFKQNIAFIKNKNIMDLVFLIDASSTVGQHNFNSELKFVKKLLSDVTVDYNHTRVAVVTFSSSGSIIKTIDEISKPKAVNNKCLLLNKEINNITYTGGATYTIGAFKAAKEIFQNSRPESEKVLFLITDGYSNGGDPVPVANELKKEQVTIFTIGVSNGNVKELYEIATQPGELHSYLLDSFEEFESLARRALHVDLQSGDYYPLGISAPCDKLCEGGNCCDKNAYCTCGTSTGQYSCICKLGYYGSGLENSCLPCPSGSYAEGPNLCLPCPDIHHYSHPPAIGIKSCKCKGGFQNSPNATCEVISCPKVPPLEHGYFVKKKECSTVLNSACGVRCNVGYILSGSSIRLCQEDGTWSGAEPSCQIKTCTKLQAPSHGSISCNNADHQNFTTESHMPVDTTCSFKCDRGYTLIGSASRTCLPLAQWDGLRSACKQMKCTKLSKINFGLIEPKSCSIGKQPYGKECKFTCLEGFDLIGPSQKKCADGVWDSREIVTCNDVTPPDLMCPDNVVQNTLPGKQYGLVSLTIPLVTDNSYLNVTTWSKPVSKGPYKFKIGTHQVSFYAQDVFNNKAKCSFNVTIIDNEPPTIEGCIDPPVFISQGPANISWDVPSIYDNSQHVSVESNRTSSVFQIGRTQIMYTATDGSNNTNVCILNITVEEPACPTLPSPDYGTSVCNTTDGKTQCVVTCNEGYVLPVPTNVNIIQDNTTQFFCDDQDATWSNNVQLASTDCTINEVPVEIEQTGIITTNESCDDQERIAKVQKKIQKSLEQNTIEICTNGVMCDITTVPECDDEFNNLVKREIITNSTQQKRRKKKANFRVLIKGQNKIKKVIDHFISNGTINGYNVTVNELDFTCPSGSYKRKLKCINCPLGTFLNTTSNICQSCNIGTYNDKMGQVTCTKCPENYSTRKLHARNKNDCIEKCHPGSFARRKQIKHPKNHPSSVVERLTLRPYCTSCALGTFQPEYGQTSCLSCPANKTTAGRGAKYITECNALQHPCLSRPCIHGSCLPSGDYGYTCRCSQHYAGNHCEVFMNPCNSQPCQNDGKCVYSETFGYTGFEVIVYTTYICECPEGYKGRNCGEIISHCDLSCKNNATCVITEEDEPICLCPVGYYGKLCEDKIEKCQSGLCENNGTCNETNVEFQCVCQDGFSGKRCQYVPCDFKPCPEGTICLNSNKTDNFTCICPLGYQGLNCSTRIDYCSSKPCQNHAQCNSTLGGFTCLCQKGYTGSYCEIELPRDYILKFPRSGVTDFIEMPGFETDLSEISVCFWIQTTDSFNYGTILSYANEKYYNAFTLTDYTGIVLYINNDHIVTDILLNDGNWHHVCITWENKHGNYSIFLDSEQVHTGINLSKLKPINGKGKFILGQEQDSIGGKFSQSESFLGKLGYMHVFSKVLTSSEISNIMNNCSESQLEGDIYKWSEFSQNIHGDIIQEPSKFCQECPSPTYLKHGTFTINNNVAYYTCEKGFQLNHQEYKTGRKCLKSGRWEGNNPTCSAVSCGHPVYIANGYFIGNNFTYGHKIEYKCNHGFSVVGPATQICNELGVWLPKPPKCLSVMCPKPMVRKTATVEVHLGEEDDEEVNFQDMDTFSAGTQLDISCPEDVDDITTLTCRSDGTWDHAPPQCRSKYSLSCNINHIPEAPDNGYRVEESYQDVLDGLSDTIKYVCRKGYRRINGNFSTCIVDGYWSELKMRCQAIRCKPPREMTEYGLRLSQGQSTIYELGHMIRYECVGHMRSIGNFIVRCIYPGLWSKLNGYCEKR